MHPFEKQMLTVVRQKAIGLLILDPLNGYLDASKIDVNKEQQVRQALRPLRDFAENEIPGAHHSKVVHTLFPRSVSRSSNTYARRASGPAPAVSTPFGA